MKFIFIILVSFITLYSYQTTFINAYALTIFDNKKSENIQTKYKTKYNYENEVYITIVVFAKALNNKPTVNIGSSIGHYISSKRVIKNRLIIGHELTYKFYTVTKGYLEIRYDNKLYDGKTFIK